MHPDVQLRVLVPNRWNHYGAWRAPEMPHGGQPFEFSTEKIVMPWLGPAQYYMHCYPHLAAVMREFQPDVIDLWEEPWAAVSAQACMLRKRVYPKAKIVCETEQNLLKTLPLPFEGFRNYVLHRTDHAIARSKQAVEVLRAKGFLGPVTVVPNGVNPDHFRPMDRAECRAALGLTGFIAGYAGRFVEGKGLTDLVDAVALSKVPASLVLIGSGAMEQTLRDRITAAGIGDRVRILPDQPHTRLPALMNAMDCLVLPSRTTHSWKEQFGRVLIEAGACGIPVIGSDSGAIPDVIGPAGLVFPEGDVKALAAALERLRLDPAYAQDLGSAGRAQVKQHYSWQKVADKMVRVYERILSDSAVPNAVTSEAIKSMVHAAGDPSVARAIEV